MGMFINTQYFDMSLYENVILDKTIFPLTPMLKPSNNVLLRFANNSLKLLLGGMAK